MQEGEGECREKAQSRLGKQLKSRSQGWRLGGKGQAEVGLAGARRDKGERPKLINPATAAWPQDR